MKITLKQAAVLAIALTLTGAALPLGTASANTGVQVNDCGTLQTRPSELILACADANEYLDNVKWKSWKSKKATGTATYKINDCEPTCADGTFESYRVRVTLKSPKRQSGERVFSTAVLRFPKGGPTGEKKMTERLARYVPSSVPDDASTPQPTAPQSPEPSVEPAPTPAPTPSISASPTPSPTPTPTPTPTAEATEQQEAISLEVIEQRRMSGRLRIIVEASSTAGGDRRGIKDVTVIRYNEYNAGLDYDATWAGPYQPTKWTAMTSCDSKNKERTDVVVTSNSGKTETFRIAARTGC